MLRNAVETLDDLTRAIEGDFHITIGRDGEYYYCSSRRDEESRTSYSATSLSEAVNQELDKILK